MKLLNGILYYVLDIDLHHALEYAMLHRFIVAMHKSHF